MKKYSAVKVIICMTILFIWLVISPVAFLVNLIVLMKK